jgi:hypothetical protein
MSPSPRDRVELGETGQRMASLILRAREAEETVDAVREVLDGCSRDECNLKLYVRLREVVPRV